MFFPNNMSIPIAFFITYIITFFTYEIIGVFWRFFFCHLFTINQHKKRLNNAHYFSKKVDGLNLKKHISKTRPLCCKPLFCVFFANSQSEKPILDIYKCPFSIFRFEI